MPSNVLIIDTTTFERQLFRIGERPGSVIDPHTSLSRQVGTSLSLNNLLRSLGIDTSGFVFHNSGNDAFAALVALQLLLEPETTLKKMKQKTEEDSPVSPTTSAIYIGPTKAAAPTKTVAPAIPAKENGSKKDIPAALRVGHAGVGPVPHPVHTTGFGMGSPKSPTTGGNQRASEAAAASAAAASAAAGRGQGQGQRRGKGRTSGGTGGAGAKTAQQIRDAKLENAMKNLDL